MLLRGCYGSVGLPSLPGPLALQDRTLRAELSAPIALGNVRCIFKYLGAARDCVFRGLMTCVYHSLFVLLSATALLPRRFSSGPPSKDVTYEQLKVLLASQKSTVIDVREPWELREYGIIPGSINVPCECFKTLVCLRHSVVVGYVTQGPPA